MMNGNEKRDPCDDERDTKNQIEKVLQLFQFGG